MTSITRKDYLSLRRVYEPQSPTLIIVAESPPASGRYFYNPAGNVTEPLFAAMMKQLNFSASSKEAGLRAFQREGWILVDATYKPVNMFAGPARAKVIDSNYPLLRKDLRELTGKLSIPLLLLKANVCRLLGPKLVADGFTVINRGRVVYFPSTGQQARFHEQFREVLNGTGQPVAVC